jgi:hypothetical protein
LHASARPKRNRAEKASSVDEQAWLRSLAATPGALGEEVGAPVLVDRSRTELPDAAQLIAQHASIPDRGP